MDLSRIPSKKLTVKLTVFFLAIVSLSTFTLLRISDHIFEETRNERDLVLTDSPTSGRLIGALSRHIRGVQEECSENFTVGINGVSIKSPGYPDRYQSNQDCRWVLSASEDAHIVVTIKSLDLEKDRNCEMDYLRVYEGSSTLSQPIQQLCGSIRNRVITTNSSTVLLVFHSDPSYEDKGFHLECNLQMRSGCPSELAADSGIISSPGFPINYPDDTDCWTVITVDGNRNIILQFNVLDLEYDDNCTYDYVEIYNGPLRDAPLIGRFCLPTQKAPVHSMSNELLVHFHSDHLISRKGFQARYTSIPSKKEVDLNELGGCLWDEVPNSNGSIASPNYPQKYPNNAKCNVLIAAPPDNVINLVFDTMQLEVDANCSYDYVELIESTPDDSSQGIKLCGKENEQRRFTTSQNTLFLLFRSDDFLQFSGFKARYWFQQTENGSTDEGITEVSSQSEGDTMAENFTPEEMFLEKPQNSTVAIGSSLMLQCAVSDPIAKIRWLKDEQFLGGNTPLPGLKLVANNTLWIQGMSRHLAGVYTCAAVTPEKTHYAKAWVKLENDLTPEETPCDIVFLKEPRNSSFTEGEYAYMECLAIGSKLEVHWEKDGRRLETKKRIIVARNGFLSIDDVTLKDAGPYTCVTTDVTTGCRKQIQAFLTVNGKAKLREICGKPRIGQPSNEKPHLDHGKIVGGHNTAEGAYPWQVMLWEPYEKAFCGGVLINERWIITAAHCLKNYKNIRWDNIVIKLGKYNREKEKEEHEFQTVIADQSAAVIVHPAYSKVSFDNDLALIRLRDHVKFTDHILPVCLGDPQLLDEITMSKSIVMGTVTGWGKLKEKGASPKYLQEIQMPIVEQAKCIKSTNFTVTRNMFCAGYAQEIIGDACYGDSGGPFIVRHEDKWYLYGIVSWGEGCGQPNKYGFYTKVRSYVSWIKGIMKS